MPATEIISVHLFLSLSLSVISLTSLVKKFQTKFSLYYSALCELRC